MRKWFTCSAGWQVLAHGPDVSRDQTENSNLGSNLEVQSWIKLRSPSAAWFSPNLMLVTFSGSLIYQVSEEAAIEGHLGDFWSGGGKTCTSEKKGKYELRGVVTDGWSFVNVTFIISSSGISKHCKKGGGRPSIHPGTCILAIAF